MVGAGNGRVRRDARGISARDLLHHASMTDLGDKVTWVPGERDAASLIAMAPKDRDQEDSLPEAARTPGSTLGAEQPLRPAPQAALNSITAQPRSAM